MADQTLRWGEAHLRGTVSFLVAYSVAVTVFQGVVVDAQGCPPSLVYSGFRSCIGPPRTSTHRPHTTSVVNFFFKGCVYKKQPVTSRLPNFWFSFLKSALCRKAQLKYFRELVRDQIPKLKLLFGNLAVVNLL